jgi:hypothetical protein
MTDRNCAEQPVGAGLGLGTRIDCNEAASYQWRSLLTEISEDPK